MSDRLSYASLYEAFDQLQIDRARTTMAQIQPRNSFERFVHSRSGVKNRDGFLRMQACRDALDALDRKGWQRSFHQRMFHENFIRACARVFYKTEPQGTFARAHQAILDYNGWDNLAQEILISTPRRQVMSVGPRPASEFPKSVSERVPKISQRASSQNQPGPAQVPSGFHTSTPLEGLQIPLARTCRLPRTNL